MSLVLVVLDEPHTLLTLQAQVEAGGYQTVLAADADTALARLAAYPVDAVLLDLSMPVRDGWTVLEALHHRARPPAVVVLSAGDGEVERAARYGVTFASGDVLRTLSRLLS